MRNFSVLDKKYPYYVTKNNTMAGWLNLWQPLPAQPVQQIRLYQPQMLPGSVAAKKEKRVESCEANEAPQQSKRSAVETAFGLIMCLIIWLIQSSNSALTEGHLKAVFGKIRTFELRAVQP